MPLSASRPESPAPAIDDRSELFLAVDAAQRVVAANGPMLECLGLRQDQALGRPLAEILRGTRLEGLLVPAGEAIRTQLRSSVRASWASGADAPPRHYDFVLLPLSGIGGLALACTAREQRDGRPAEADLIEAASREQRRLDRDLHDSLGQELAHASMLLHSLERRIHGEAPQLAPLCRDIREAFARARESLRATVYGLAPADLAGSNLGAALGRLAARHSRHDAIEVSFASPAELPALPPEVAEHVYRFAQEAVSNALRHAAASRVAIELAVDAGHLLLAIADDGVGLDLAAAQRAPGMGLRFMRYRAQCIGGELRFSSNGTGTRVVLTVPLGTDAPRRPATHSGLG